MENKPQKVDLRALFNRSYAGQYITPVEIDHPIQVKIASLSTETVKSWQKGAKPEERLILHFEGKTRGMVVNKTNMKILTGMLGWDQEGWIGKDIVIASVEVEAFGRVVDSIEVRPAMSPKTGDEERIEEGEVKI